MTAADTSKTGERIALACAIADIASRAGATILRLAAGNRAARLKGDNSPVTDADEAAEALIVEELARLVPGVPVVGEEAAARSATLLPRGPYFSVDPLDGTREFIAGGGDYTVNIALIENHTPVLGVLYAPQMNLLYAGGDAQALRAMIVPGMPFERAAALPIRVRPRGAGLVAYVSRSHADSASESLLANLGVNERIPEGSSIKFARIAEGAADIYARLIRMHEWDIAAGHALVEAAGGRVTAPDGNAIRYGEREDFWVDGFVAWGAQP